MKTLVLYANYSNTSSYYDDWKDAFENDKELDVKSLDICKISKDNLKKYIGQYELIILLHSANADNLKYLQNIADCLLDRKGKLVSFVGNEVNIAGISMVEKIGLLKKINPDIICTQLLEDTGKWLYSSCFNSKVISIPHALNANIFKPGNLHQYRDSYIGVRSFQYSVHLGDQERTIFFNKIKEISVKKDFPCDISFDPTKRFKRDEWVNFLQNNRGTIATEAGTYYLDKDDKLVSQIQNYLLQIQNSKEQYTIKNDSLLFKIYSKVPPKTKQFMQYIYYKYAGILGIKYEYLLTNNQYFDEIYENIIKNYKKCEFYSKTISSRHFDAIGTKTTLIMLEGRYNDILIPNEHYFEIKKDYSNLNETMDIFLDVKKSNEMADRAYEYVISNHLHMHRIEKIKRELK